jgi:hypothetical protein
MMLKGMALAQTPTEHPFADTPETAEADALFNQLLKDPKNIDLTFRYAEAAIKAGNIEGGISSLERLLLLDRNFPGIKIQLAELYARIQSYDQAKTYLSQAREEPGVDQQTLARIETVQDEVDRGQSGTRLTSNLLIGIRHQSNASAEPAGSDIVAGGVPETLSTIYFHKAAWDAFSTGNIQYTKQLGEVQVESNAIAYYSKSLGHSTLDLGAVEFNSGPRFDVDIEGTHLFSARPYAVANEVLLGESQFLHTAGGGLGIDRSITDKLSGSAFYEYRREWFSNVALAPAAETMNADVHSFGTGLAYRLFDDGDLNFQTSYALTDDVAIGSNRNLVFRLAYSQLVHLPKDFSVGPLNLSPLVYRIYTRDHSPDLSIGPATIPATDEWRYGMAAKLGLTQSIALNFDVINQITTSNVAANRSHDTQLILGVVFAY